MSLAATVLALVAAGCARDGGPGQRADPAGPPRAGTAGCVPARPHDPGQSAGALRAGGLIRTYHLYVPERYRGDTAVPLVVNFHGYGSSGAQQIAYGDFRPVADRHGFVVVAPDGQGDPRHFNLRGGDGAEANDVEFAVALVDHLVGELCIDSRRVYATGMSNGGALTSILACLAADRFAAFGPVAALVGPNQCGPPDRPVPIAAFMGTDDAVVPFDGGTVRCCGNPEIQAAPVTMANWAAHNGCAPEPVVEQPAPEVEVRRWQECQAGGDTVFYVIVGGGHAWPGAGVHPPRLGHTTSQISATETLWEFFRTKSLP